MTSSRLRELSRAEEVRQRAEFEAWWVPHPTWYKIANGTHLYGVAFDAWKASRALPPAALRNDAEKYADLRDAVKAYKDAVDDERKESDSHPFGLCRDTTYRRTQNTEDAMFAALAAFGGEE